MLTLVAHRHVFTLIGAIMLVVAIANPAAAPPGDLDPTFDGDGRVTTDFAGGDDEAFAVAIQADGKIVTAGIAENTFGWALARYRLDGSLDPSFGEGDGRVTPISGVPEALAIQGDGRIVVAGWVFISGFPNFVIARHNPDGSLDPTFGGGNGFVTTAFGGEGDEGSAHAVAVQGDGKIVAGGVAIVSGNRAFALARYSADGSLDPTFDGDGRVTTDFVNSTADEAHGVAIQGDGKIVAAGWTHHVDPTCCFESDDFALARYNTDGSLDTTFGFRGDGTVNMDFDLGQDRAFAVAIQSDGKIVTAGFAVVAENRDFALARFMTDGFVDQSFGPPEDPDVEPDYWVNTDFGSFDEASGVAIQSDGKIVAAGRAHVPDAFSFDFALARYKPDGFLDPIFSGDGKVTTDFELNNDQVEGVAIQSDGKIVAAGCVNCGADSQLDIRDFAVARYTVCRRTSRPTSIPPCR